MRVDTPLTPRERVLRRLTGDPVDKIPNLNIVMAFAARHIGVKYSQYATDYRVLAEGNIRCCEDFGIDMVSAISDPCREAGDLGAPVSFPDDDIPMLQGVLIQDYGDIAALKPIPPREGRRMLDRIQAIELYRQLAGRDYPVLGWVEGAFAESCDLRGLSNMMVDIATEPEFVRDLLEICTEQAIAFATEQIKAGADFIGIGDAAASLIGPKYFESFALPFEKRICDAVHHAGAKVKLHICGNITPILNQVALSGADIVDADWMVDFHQAAQCMEGICSVCGNFDPVSILLQGSPDDVRKSVIQCVQAGNDATFVAAGCEVPLHTPAQNLRAVHEALQSL